MLFSSKSRWHVECSLMRWFLMCREISWHKKRFDAYRKSATCQWVMILEVNFFASTIKEEKNKSGWTEMTSTLKMQCGITRWRRSESLLANLSWSFFSLEQRRRSSMMARKGNKREKREFFCVFFHLLLLLHFHSSHELEHKSFPSRRAVKTILFTRIELNTLYTRWLRDFL